MSSEYEEAVLFVLNIYILPFVMGSREKLYWKRQYACPLPQKNVDQFANGENLFPPPKH